MSRNLLLVLTVVFIWTSAPGQLSDRVHRRTAILNGNQVRTVFGNWGVIGQPAEAGKRGAWKDDNNGYLGDVSPMVGAEVRWQDTSFHAVITTPTARPQANPRSEDPVTGKPWAFEPEGGYFAPAPNQSVAISNNPSTWPPEWPDKLNDPSDPGWRGSWNGYFGKRASADLETYYVMDDNNFERFGAANNNSRGIAFRPDSTNLSRNGLGLRMSVRGLQWAQFLAQDNIFWLYEITNTGTTTYNKVLFGMIVGTYVGVTSTENAGEYDDDWSFYDPRQNITYTGDYDRNTQRNPRWAQRFRVGMVGYAFLESPGNPFDGIDNDGDADSTAIGRGAPQFISSSFDSTLVTAGMRLVIIQDDFSRTLLTVPAVDSLRVKTRGMRDSIWIRPGVTKLVEGNVISFAGNTFVNRNAYDGVDNDFDGLIDENFYLHYRQLKRGGTPPRDLINILRPLRYVNHVTGEGTNPLAMIDEKRNDLLDNDNDWSRDKTTGQVLIDPEGNLIDDVGRDGIQGTNDFGERDGRATSGYDNSFRDTGLPGEPNIDKTDVDESDQIGLSSFYYFTPAGNLSLGDDENLWRILAPGYFDVPPSIVYDPVLGTSRPERGEDGDFTYSSGYFPLLAGAIERFSIALVYGGGKGGSLQDDVNDLLKNKRTVQKIYDANYQFPTPPDKPTLTAVPGDKQVTLYWDRRAEFSLDPVLKTSDFQGYKIYKSTDPNFSDVYTITDGSGTPRGYRPAAQFDKVDSIRGYFQATGELFEAAQGYNIYLGDDTGLQHSLVDKDVDNGRRYFYAIVAYDRGDDAVKIFPSENNFLPSVSTTGEITHDINVAVVTPNAKVAGYEAPESGVLLDRLQSFGTGTVAYNVIDQTRITGNRYTVTYLDSKVDGIDNNGNGLIDLADSTELDRKTSFYYVKDNTEYVENFTSLDTSFVHLLRKNQDSTTVVVRNSQGSVVPSANYRLDVVLGTIRGATVGSLPQGQYTITYKYFPVFHSPYLRGSPFVREAKDADIFDGVQLDFNNAWSVSVIDSLSGWLRNQGYVFSFSPLSTEVNNIEVFGFRNPQDYLIQVFDSIVDTSTADPFLFVDPIPVYFRVLDPKDSSRVPFIYSQSNPRAPGRLSATDEIVFFEDRPNGSRVYSWDLQLTARPGHPADTVYNLTGGDGLMVRVTKPFQQRDVMEFTPAIPRVTFASVSPASSLLGRIRVVPNPYVAASSFELPLPPGISSGRGERRIDFIHLPAQASVKIFTARGDHVVTLYHDGNIEDGTVRWNLKTKENLDIAFGVYFYVVESPIGNKTGKIAIIK